MNSNFVIVDDSPDILEFARLAICDIGGSQATCFNSGVELLDGYKGLSEPDRSILLIDMMMPVLTGLETLTKLSEELKRGRFTPIFMTACLHDNYIQQYKDSGAVGLVHKPFDPLLLFSQISDRVMSKSDEKKREESEFFIIGC